MSNFQIRYLEKAEYSLWDSFVDNCDGGTIFHKSSWILSLNRTIPELHHSIIACFKDGVLLGGVNLTWKNVFSLKYIVQPFATPFYGLLIKERESEFISKRESYRLEMINEILDFVESKYHKLAFIFPPQIDDVRPFSWRNYSSSIRYTYKAFIGDPITLYEKLLPSLKRQIKKGEKLDYTLTTGNDAEHISVIYKLLEKSYGRQKHSFPFSENGLHKFLIEPEISNSFNISSIWQNDNPVSAIITIIDNGVAYYWLAGGDHEYFNTGLNQVLLWKVIQKLSEEGVEYMDMVGANTQSIANYKAGLNFSITPYYLVEKSTHFIVRLNDAKRYLLKNKVI